MKEFSERSVGDVKEQVDYSWSEEKLTETERAEQQGQRETKKEYRTQQWVTLLKERTGRPVGFPSRFGFI